MDEYITPDLPVFKAFGEALAIGLMLGVERYKARAPGESGAAGVRTFTLFALLGAVCGLLQQPLFTAIVFAVLGSLIAIAYYRNSSESLGATTETAAVLTFWLGYLVHSHGTLAVSAAIVATVILAAKQSLHAFVRESISEIEFWDTLKFLVVVFVVYPLLPDRYIGPYDFFNPSRVWFLIILVSSISYLGYLAIRLMGPRRGVGLSSLVGAIASTVAVTVSLAERARSTPKFSRFLGATAVMANAVQYPRLLFLIWIVSPPLTQHLASIFLAMVLASVLAVQLIARHRKDEAGESVTLAMQNPYSFTPALKFGLFFAVITLALKLANQWLGSQGLLLASLLGGLASVSAVALANADIINTGTVSPQWGAAGILVAIVSNATLKLLFARFNGTPSFAWWLGLGLAGSLFAGFLAAVATLVLF